MGTSNSKSSKKDKKNGSKPDNNNDTTQNAAVQKRDKKGKAGKTERPLSMPTATLDFPANFSTRPNPEGDISGRRPGKYASELVRVESFARFVTD